MAPVHTYKKNIPEVMELYVFQNDSAVIDTGWGPKR